MSKPTATQTWAGVMMAALAILSSYLGYEKYEASKAEPGNQSVEVHIESVPDSLSGLGRVEVERMIEKAIRSRHEKNLHLFKKKESWDTEGQ